MPDPDRCHVCGKTVLEAGSLRRISPKGQTPAVWACHKHTERMPCKAPFCRRTFKAEPGTYYEVMCSKHWRLAPEHMRKAVTRVKRQGNRYGWSDDMIARYERLWHRTARAAIDVILSGGGDA